MLKGLVRAACAALVVAVALGAGPSGAQAQERALTPAEEARVRALVRETLLSNPEIIEEAVEALQAKRVAELRAKIEADPRHHAIGPRDAPITVVEYFDYRCGFCKAAADWVFVQARQPDVRVVFKEFPVLGPDSEEASRAAIASLRQGGARYVQFHQAMMAHRGALDAATIDRLAQRSGVDVRRMRRDMAAPTGRELIADNLAIGSAAGVQGTPAFMINGAFVYGFDQAALDAAMKRARDAAKAKKR